MHLQKKFFFAHKLFFTLVAVERESSRNFGRARQLAQLASKFVAGRSQRTPPSANQKLEETLHGKPVFFWGFIHMVFETMNPTESPQKDLLNVLRLLFSLQLATLGSIPLTAKSF